MSNFSPISVAKNASNEYDALDEYCGWKAKGS